MIYRQAHTAADAGMQPFPWIRAGGHHKKACETTAAEKKYNFRRKTRLR